MLLSTTRHQLSLIATFVLLLTLSLPLVVQAQSGPPVKSSPGMSLQSSPSATSSPSSEPSPQASPSVKSATISSTAGWQKTAWIVKKGNLFSISYTSGTWAVDAKNFPSVDPDGYPPDVDKKIFQGCKYDSSLPYATLLGQIGNGPDFRVGTGGTFVASASGTVSLRINDQDACLGDNAGSIVVTALTFLPGMRLPWDRTLINIPLNGGPHSNAHAGQACYQDPISSLSGLDFGLKYGTDVLAVAAGKVFLAMKVSDSRGPYIVGVDHGHNFATEYWHLSAINSSINVGVPVVQGTLLGKSGYPNGSPPSDAHLHLEFRTGSPGYSKPYSAQGMLIDGYQAWTEALGSIGYGLNYQGTMTHGAAQTQPYNDTFCNQQVTQWYAPNGITIYAQSDGSGGDLKSSNAEIPLMSGKTGQFFYNPNNSGPFDVNPSTPPVFTQNFQAYYYNPPPSSNNNDPNDPLRVNRQTCIQSSGVDENTRPFTDVVPNADGSCTLTIVKGNGQQAGLGNMSSFEAVFYGNLFVPYAGNVIFHVYADDGWILSIGPNNGSQPTYVSGPMNNVPPTGPFTGYPAVGGNNDQSNPTEFTLTVNVPAAGTYPIELDYTECCQGTLTLVFTPGYN